MRTADQITPPKSGLAADPVRYGVAEALRELFPPAHLDDATDGRDMGEDSPEV